MKILAISGRRRICIMLATAMIFNGTPLSLHLKIAKWQVGRYTEISMPDIEPEKMKLLCAEIRRIKRKYKTYDMVEVCSADGDHVKITL